MAIINLKPFYKEDLHLQKQFRKQVMAYGIVIKRVDNIILNFINNIFYLWKHYFISQRFLGPSK